MSASGFTPIQLFRTTTAAAVPTAGSLADGELAINLTDEALYFKNAAGVVTLLADSSGSLGSVTSVNASGGTTGLTFSGGPITTSGTLTLGGTLAVANGGTGVTTSTGTGSVVLNTSPTLVTPALGVASADSIATLKGTVGSVAYGFIGNTNTGMWSPSSDAIAFSTAGSERLRVDASGNVGVGTASPLTRLNLEGGSFLLRGGTIDIGPTAGANGAARISSSLANVVEGTLIFSTQNSSAAMTERMRIDSAGNVGIGITSVTPIFGTTVKVYNAGSGGTLEVGGATINARFFGSEGAGIAGVGTTTNTAFNFITNDAERARIDSSGNVGIGTSSPGARLDVNGGTLGGTAGNSLNLGRFFGSTGNANQIIPRLIRTSNGSDWTTTTTRLQGRIDADDFGYIDLILPGVQGLALGSGGSERMRISSAGNLGLGLTGPVARLNVAAGAAVNAPVLGNAANYPAFFSNNDSSYGLGIGTSSADGHVWLQAQRADSAVSYNITLNEAGGNVGIGTVSPTGKVGIAISGSRTLGTAWDTSSVLIGSPGQFSGNLGISFDTTNGATLESTAPGVASYPIRIASSVTQFFTSNVERARIDASGNFGIGTSSPASRFQVNGLSGAGQLAYFENNSTGSSLGGVAVSINSGGNNTNSFHFLGVTQTVALWYLYGNGTTSYTSDIRVKKNVETTRDGYLDDVCKLRVVKYNWYNDTDDTPRELGLIAQEVEQVFPGLVQDAAHPTKDGVCHKVLKGSVLTPILLKALQEANEKIDALTARVAQLEATTPTITFEGN